VPCVPLSEQVMQVREQVIKGNAPVPCVPLSEQVMQVREEVIKAVH
jgi:hypothetical protein